MERQDQSFDTRNIISPRIQFESPYGQIGVDPFRYKSEKDTPENGLPFLFLETDSEKLKRLLFKKKSE
jgi:hypothetical protein